MASIKQGEKATPVQGSTYCPYDQTSQNYDSTRAPLGLNVVLGSMAMSNTPLKCQKLLDVGCGTGTFLKAVKDRVNMVVGLEYSEGMLGQAKKHLGDDVTLVQGSADRLPFDDGSFDAVTINQVIHHFPGGDNFAFAKRVFEEMFRVLAPSGTLIINTSTPEQQRDSFWWMSLFPKASEEMCKRFPPLDVVRLHLKESGFIFNADSVTVPLHRTLMAEDKYLEHGVRSGFLPGYRAGDSSWAMAEKLCELEAGLEKLQHMIDDGSAEQWLKNRETMRLQLGQATFISVQKSSQSSGPLKETLLTDIQKNLWPDNNSTNPVAVAGGYNSSATTYETNVMQDGWQATFNHLIPELDASLKAGAKVVLDAGCSTGLLPKVYIMPPDVELHGVDIAAACLALAQDTGKYASLQEANLEEILPFTSDMFDVVVCNGVLGYCESNKPLRELLRVLKPAGKLLMSFREQHYLQRGYDKLLEDPSNGGRLLHSSLYDPFPNNPGYSHTYITAIVEKTVKSELELALGA